MSFPSITRWMYRPLPALVAALLAASSPALAQQDAAALWAISFPRESSPVREWMRDNSITLGKGSVSGWKISEGALYMQASGVSTELDIRFVQPISVSKTSRIEFVYKVISVPAGADLRIKEKEDSAFRVFVAFNKAAKYMFVMDVPDSIAYSHGTATLEGAQFKFERFANVFGVVTGAGAKDDWIKASRNLYSDYKGLFNEEPPAIIGVKIKIDSNNTGGLARTYLRALRITK